MITNEMKAKIFMLYGLDISINTPKGVFPVVSYKRDCILTINLLPWSYNECQLILKPLSEITDEDCIEVAKMHYEDREEMIDKSPDRYIKNVKEHVLQPIGLLPYYFVDFLRSKGYALPAFGIDLFQSSLAIPKQ